MKRRIFLGGGLLGILIIGSFSFSVFAQDPQLPIFEIKNNSGSAKFVPGQLIVGLEKPDPHFNEKASINGGQVINSIEQINAHVVKIPINTEEKFMAAMSKNPNVRYVERDGIVNALDIPNDPLYPAQWGTKRIGMESVWNFTNPFDPASGIMIAVIDEGLYYDHPDFFGTNIRTDIDYDFVDGDNDTKPTKNCLTFPSFEWEAENHGTWVTGVIVAAVNDNFGITGVGNFDVLPIRVLNECGGGSYSVVAQGIIYAADNGADVINLSLGSGAWEVATLHNAVKYATASPAEAVVVAAAGNDGNSSILYPAGFEEVISVGATAVNDEIASYSQFGSTLDLSAPGAEAPEGSCDINNMTYIFTSGVHTTTGNTSPENPSWEYHCVAGTSFAAPYVSAVAGLVKSAYPNATNEDIKCHLEQTSEDLGSNGWDQYFGHGLVRADSATSSLQLIPSSQCEGENNPPTANVGGPYTGTEGQAISFDGSGSTDPDGDALTYSWDFGDLNTGTGVSPSHTYATAGSYTVTLTVNDGNGGTDNSSTSATIDAIPNNPPTADAGGPYAGTEGVAIIFDGSGSTDSDGTIVSYDWNFGDGNTGTGISPSHTYAASGTYSVSLTVTDDDGATDDTDSPTDAIIDPSPNNPATITITSPPSGEISGKITITAIIDGFESAVDNVLFNIYKIVDGNTQTTPSHSDSDSNAPYSISIHTKNMENGFYYDIIASANDNGEDVESDPVRVYLPAKGDSGGGPDCTAKPNHPKCQ